MTITSCSRSQSTAQDYLLLEDKTNLDDSVLIPYLKYRLKNNLTVLLVPDDSDPIVHVEMTYHVGSSREEVGHSGFAHLFEHMMFQGSKNVGDHEHFRLIAESGGTMNGATNKDLTYYYQTLPKNHLEMALWLEADRMGFLLPALTEKKFLNQKSVVKNERVQRVDNKPYGRVGELMSQALYPERHPYSWPVIGWLEDIEAAQKQDIENFFSRWYGPNNATLTIGGDFDKEQVMNWVVQYFGTIPEGPAVTKAEIQPVQVKQDKYLTLEDRVNTPSLLFRFPTIHAYHEDEAALDILAKLFGGGKTSLLYQLLVKEGDFYQANVSHHCYEQACEFSLSVVTTPQKEVDLKKVEQRLLDAIEEFEHRGVQDIDLRKIKSHIEVGMVHQLNSIASKVSILSNYEVLLSQPNYMYDEMLSYSRVTADDIMRVYRKYIKGQAKVVMSVVPYGAKDLSAGDNFIAPNITQRKPSHLNFPERIIKQDHLDRSKRPLSEPMPHVRPPNFWRTKLPEDVDVIGCSIEAPITEVMIKIRGGMDLERPDQAGLARLTALMLQESTREHMTEELLNQLESMGSSIRFGVSMHDVCLHLSCLSKHYSATMAILQEMALKPAFHLKDFERLQQKTLAALEQRGMNVQSVTKDHFNTLLFGTESRYSIPLMGNLETVASLTIQDIKDFYAQQYMGQESQVTMLTNASQKDSLAQLSWLSQWKGCKAPLLKQVPFNSAAVNTLYLVDVPHAEQCVIKIGKIGKPFDVDGAYFKSNLANYAFGGYFNSRINLNLREEKGFTYGVNSAFSGDTHFGIFHLATDVQIESTAYAVHELIAEMQRYQQYGASQEEVDFMRASLLQQQALSYETPAQKMSFLAEIQRYQLPDNFPKIQDDILIHIKQKELNLIIAEEFCIEDMLILVAGPAEKIQTSLAKLGLPLVVLP